MRKAAGRIPIARGWVVAGIRASRADREKHFHACNSAACSGRDFRLFTFDLQCGDIGALQRAFYAGEGCGYKEVRVIGPLYSRSLLLRKRRAGAHQYPPNIEKATA